MGWNPSLVDGPFNWPWLFGFHMNVARDALPDAAAVAIIEPTSPDVVFAGDAGVPAKLPVLDKDGNKIGSSPNPAPAVPFETVFLLFVDEAEALELMPELWHPDEPAPAIGAP